MRKLLGPIVLEVAVFVCGALVMVYEIIGSRIVAPYIGTSTYIWTSLIGVILAALSLGYCLGGRFADRYPNVGALSAAIFMAGGAVSVTILIKDAVLSAVASAGGPLELKAVAAAALLFAPASVLLGFVTPYAVKLRTLSLEDSGKTVGRLYALSTIGSIVGTFAAGFLLIPFLGSSRTLYLIAALLFGVALLLAPFAFNRANFAAVTLLFFGIASSEAAAYFAMAAGRIADVDTEYSRIQVFESTDQKTGRRFRAIATDPYFAQSAMYLDDGSSAFEYTKFFGLVDHFKPDHKKVLMIGGAGYTVPKDYLRDHPTAEIDVVEIDPGMTEIARKYFNLKDDPRMHIFHEDGRVFLNRAPSQTYDAIFIDAFGSLFSIPFQLTTAEAVDQIRRTLSPNGIVIVNIGSAISGSGSGFLKAEVATYLTVFPRVLLFKVRPEQEDEGLQNVILLACESDCVINYNSSDPRTEALIKKYHANGASYSPPFPVTLSDELAPVEFYSSVALANFR